jgi:hypothetical protein
MEISEYLQKVLCSISNGVADFNSANRDREVFAVFPQKIFFTIPLDIHGVLDWSSDHSIEKKIDFTLYFYRGSPGLDHHEHFFSDSEVSNGAE